MARHVAKNIVAAKLAERCEVQIAYAIGVSEPVSVNVNTDGTGVVADERICEVVREFFPLTPGRHHRLPEAAASDLSQDGRGRPFRPQRAGVHLGEHRPRPELAEACGYRRSASRFFDSEAKRWQRRSRLSNRLNGVRRHLHLIRLTATPFAAGNRSELGWPCVLSVNATMLVVAAWLCVRRLAGKMPQPFGFAPLLVGRLVSAAAVSYFGGALRGESAGGSIRGWSLATAPCWLLSHPLRRAAAGGGLTIRGTFDRCLVALWGCVAQ